MHADAALVGLVEHRLEPVEVEDAVLGLPGRPHRLPDADHGEPGLGHQVEVGLETRRALVLGVVGGPEADAGAAPDGCSDTGAGLGEEELFALGAALGLPLRVGDR